MFQKGFYSHTIHYQWLLQHSFAVAGALRFTAGSAQLLPLLSLQISLLLLIVGVIPSLTGAANLAGAGVAKIAMLFIRFC